MTATSQRVARTFVSRVVHFELPVQDAERAGAFYRETFGWQVEAWDGAAYWPMTTGAAPGPGAEGALAPRADLPDGILVYVAVEDVDRALASVERCGGTVVSARTPIPGVGWSARFRDSEGNVVGLFQSDERVVMPAGDGGAPGRAEAATPEAAGEEDDVAEQLAALERRMHSVGDDAQLANVDLQQVLQRQQQVLQTMTALAKMLNDTMTAVIRKIGG